MKKELIAVLSMFLFVFASCQTISITSQGYGDKLQKNNKVFLAPVLVRAFDFVSSKEIEYLINSKLQFSLEYHKLFQLSNKAEDADYIMQPQFVMKKYKENYQDYFYYKMDIVISRGNTVLVHYVYEYNGTKSIFDNQLISLFIEKIVSDIQSKM